MAGGMELGLWCDFRVMAEESYFGVIAAVGEFRSLTGEPSACHDSWARVGQWRSFSRGERSGERVPDIGLREYVTPKGGAREKAEELAQRSALSTGMRACRSSLRDPEHGLSVRDALIQEWQTAAGP